MKKYVIMCAVLLGGSYLGVAQVGIGTKTPSPSTILDVVATDKGVMLPRIALQNLKELNPVVGTKSDATLRGLIVFNTNNTVLGGTLTDNTGYYMWDGDQWQKLITLDDANQLLTGFSSISNIDTFFRTITKKDSANKDVISGYIYFSERKIQEWLSIPANDGKDYKAEMPDSDGTLIDVIGVVSNNFETIINENKEFITNVINNLEGNVSVKIDPITGDIYLVYMDKNNVEQTINLSALETNTFVRTLLQKNSDNKDVVKGYYYFSEEQIKRWIAANPGKTKTYQTDMPNADGTFFDIVGSVTDNFMDIVNNNKTSFESFLNQFLIEGGNVYFGDHDNDATSPAVLYERSVDTSSGAVTNKEINIANIFMNYLTVNEGNPEVKKVINNIRNLLGYDITSEVVSTGNKLGGKLIYTYSTTVTVDNGDAEVKGVAIPNTHPQIHVYAIKVLDKDNIFVTSNVDEIEIVGGKINFSLGSGQIYSPIAGGVYTIIVEFTEI